MKEDEQTPNALIERWLPCLLLPPVALALLIFILQLTGMRLFGFEAYGERAMTLPELVYSGSLEEVEAIEARREEVALLVAEDVPYRIRQYLQTPDVITPLYLAVAHERIDLATKLIEAGPDMQLAGNREAIALLPVVGSGRLARVMQASGHWDSLQIRAGYDGESPADLSRRLGEGSIADILEAIESKR